MDNIVLDGNNLVVVEVVVVEVVGIVDVVVAGPSLEDNLGVVDMVSLI